MKTQRATLRLSLLFAAFIGCGSAFAVPYSGTGGFDVLVREGASLNGVHVHGSTAVGGNLALGANGSTFRADPLSSGPRSAVALDIGGQLQFSGSGDHHLNHGTVRIGDASNGLNVYYRDNNNVASNTRLTTGGFDSNPKLLLQQKQQEGTAIGPSTIDIDAAFADFQKQSLLLRGLSSTLDFADLRSGSNLSFAFSGNAQLDVLNITGSDLASVSNIGFAGPSLASGGSIIVNVDLSNYTGGAFVQNRNGNAEADNILWNFFGAASVSIQNQFIGSIFAPDMHVYHSNNDIKGSVIAKSFAKQGGQIHVHSFRGELPRANVPDAGSTALMGILAFASLLAVRRRLARKS